MSTRNYENAFRGIFRIVIQSLRKALTALALFLLLSLFVFVAFTLVPGDPTEHILYNVWTPVGAAELRHKLGLDDPIPVQYVRFLGMAMHGDLGSSYQTQLPVFPTVVTSLRNSVQLASVGILIGVLLAVPVGVLAALRRNSILDVTTRAVALLLASLPAFLVGILFMYVFAVKLRLLPTTGRGSLAHIVSPAAVLALYSFPGLLRMTRASVLEILPLGYVKAARARGIASGKIIVKYVLRNAAIPLLTLGGIKAADMIGMAVITEYVFAWPGLGTTVVNAIQARDLPLIRGGILAIASVYVVINGLLDISYSIVNPRLRSGDGSS